MRPKLPSSAKLAGYLRAIDSTRIYSNYGPLARSLEDRLAERFKVPASGTISIANATVGLTLALAAQGAQHGTLCLMPAWTFVASAHAAVMAGLVPYFVDVDEGTWALDPSGLDDALANAPGPVGAVMPVVPFGCTINTAQWDAFQSRTGFPVVIDAAAAFDTLTAGTVPAVVSLHATKVLGAGEGGFVISTNSAIISDIETRANFGFNGTREATLPATNAKLSEYHAAVGLAGLDEWADSRAEWIEVARAYLRALAPLSWLGFQSDFGQSWITSTFVVRLDGVEVTRIERQLAQAGIEARRWWGMGAHAHAATQTFPRLLLPATDRLVNSTIALPFFRDLRPDQIDRVAECLLSSANA
jgi:dTDP-4-amino-4,6-dideoxygalactose transaminase